MNSTTTYSPGLSPVVIALRTIFYAIFALLILSGNILSIAVTRRVTNIAESTKVLMTSMAVCDLIIGIASVLVVVVSALDRWPFGDVACQLAATLMEVVFSILILSLTYLNIERYIAVTRPYQYLTWCTRRRAIAFVSIGSILCAPYGPLAQVLFSISAEYYESSFFCFYGSSSICFDVLNLLCFDVIPTILMSGIYYHLIKISRHHEQRLNQNGNNGADHHHGNKALKTFLVVTLTLAGCYTPWLLVRVVESFNGELGPDWLKFSTSVLCTSNSIFNVWIYCLFNPSFRKVAITIVLERFPCRSRSVAPVVI
ncbi:QRFP-like peptide receptor [Asterias amurensis]|uniref:QRFP-like peptide receptor n=1 Tax=Asterias amurensis TaxID=7602 RepID=UPI003AB3914F